MEWYEKLYQNDYTGLCGFGDSAQTRKEAEFTAEALGLSSDSTLLDICCGFGRHAFEISHLTGCSVAGVDLSDEYLAAAKEKYKSDKIKYVKGDMRDFHVDGKFDTAVNLFTSFGFFDQDDENEKVIRQANLHLKKDGLFLLDIENKFNFIFNDVLKKEDKWQQLDSGKYCLMHNEYDIINEREIFLAKIVEQGKSDVNVGYNIRLYSLPELKVMLNRNGFDLVSFWGDFDKSAYTIYSRRLITLWKKVTDPA